MFQITAPGEWTYGERPEPVLTKGHVLLGIRRLGFCGTDLNTFRGGNPLVTYPRIPGHEIGAEILATGPEVPEHFQPGQLVTVLPYTNCGTCSACRANRPNACRHNLTLGVQQEGAFTEIIAVPWEKLIAAPGLGLAELALVEPLAVGFHAAARGRVTEVDTVLVFGCGMIGLGAIAAAGLHRGARVIAVDIADGKLDLARRCGAAETINSQTQDLPKLVQQLTDGEGVDVAIEAVGAPATFTAAVDAAAFAGRVVYIGYAKASVSYETKYFVMKELDIMGSRNATAGDFADVIGLLQSGRYPWEATISRTVPFQQAGEALSAWAADPGSATKIHVEF